jgi:NADPH:quinone reductase-like Zn-dependent oxidoreductase
VADLIRPHDVRGLTAGELEQARRELRASLALARPDSPACVPILAHISAIDAELGPRSSAPASRPRLTPAGIPDGPAQLTAIATEEKRRHAVKAVRFDEYGEVDVLKVEDVPPPEPGPGQVLVQVKAAGINPGEAKIRAGLLHAMWPATFPSGQGSDLAGIVAQTGPGVTSVSAGDEVIGYTDNRASQAEFVLVEEQNLTAKPAGLPWEVAGSLFVAGATAYAAVRAVAVTKGDTVVVSGAAGGVGSIAVQLARLAGATVIGLASAAHHEWLTGHGVIPVAYGDGVDDRIRQAAGKVDAFIDTVGADYIELALKLGVEPARIDTIVRFDAVAEYGVKAEGNAAGASASVLAELAALITAGQLELPIDRAFPLSEVQDAYRHLAQGHVRGKVVLTL